MGKKIGPKEAELKAKREDQAHVAKIAEKFIKANLPDDGSLPDFLKRSETPEQAEKRRKKNKPRDETGGMKVIEPIDPKIRKAIEKDLKDDLDANKTAGGDVAIASASPKKTEKEILAFYKSGAKRPHAHAVLADLPNTLGPAIREASEDAKKKKKAKKLSPVLAKALAEKDKLNQIATATTSVENTVKKASKATAKQSKKSTSKSASKPKSNGASKRYDWRAAEENAAKGVMPPHLDFSANTHKYFRAMLADAEKYAKARSLKDLQAMKFKRTDGSPGMVKRYRDLAITAIKAK